MAAWATAIAKPSQTIAEILSDVFETFMTMKAAVMTDDAAERPTSEMVAAQKKAITTIIKQDLNSFIDFRDSGEHHRISESILSASGANSQVTSIFDLIIKNDINTVIDYNKKQITFEINEIKHSAGIKGVFKTIIALFTDDDTGESDWHISENRLIGPLEKNIIPMLASAYCIILLDPYRLRRDKRPQKVIDDFKSKNMIIMCCLLLYADLLENNVESDELVDFQIKFYTYILVRGGFQERYVTRIFKELTAKKSHDTHDKLGLKLEEIQEIIQEIQEIPLADPTTVEPKKKEKVINNIFYKFISRCEKDHSADPSSFKNYKLHQTDEELNNALKATNIITLFPIIKKKLSDKSRCATTAKEFKMIGGTADLHYSSDSSSSNFFKNINPSYKFINPSETRKQINDFQPRNKIVPSIKLTLDRIFNNFFKNYGAPAPAPAPAPADASTAPMVEGGSRHKSRKKIKKELNNLTKKH